MAEQMAREGKSTSYRQTFRQHRILLSLPIIVAVAIAAVFVLGGGKSYQSSASLWVDSPATTDSSLGSLNPALTPPSTQEQNVVTELLATPGFALAVGNNSLLASYLSSHSSGGISSILGGGGGSVSAQIMAALGPKSVTTSVPGPQVLQINYAGPSPAIAQSTLKALVKELQLDSARFSHQHNQAALNYYAGQVQSATQALLAARNQAEAYRNSHPGAQANDPNLAAFTTAETSAGAELSQAQAGLSAAKSTLTGGASANQVQVIDPPSVPVGPTSGKKKEVEGILAGLVAGLLISLLGTIALTKRESDPWEDEVAAGSAGPGGVGVPAFADARHPVYGVPAGIQLVPAGTYVQSPAGVEPNGAPSGVEPNGGRSGVEPNGGRSGADPNGGQSGIETNGAPSRPAAPEAPAHHDQPAPLPRDLDLSEPETDDEPPASRKRFRRGVFAKQSELSARN